MLYPGRLQSAGSGTRIDILAGMPRIFSASLCDQVTIAFTIEGASGWRRAAPLPGRIGSAVALPQRVFPSFDTQRKCGPVRGIGQASRSGRDSLRLREQARAIERLPLVRRCAGSRSITKDSEDQKTQRSSERTSQERMVQIFHRARLAPSEQGASKRRLAHNADPAMGIAARLGLDADLHVLPERTSRAASGARWRSSPTFRSAAPIPSADRCPSAMPQRPGSAGGI